MAVKANLSTGFGDVQDLYVRVEHVAVDHAIGDASATAEFAGYLSDDAHKAGKSSLYTKTLTFTADLGSSLWTQAYAALKSIPTVDVGSEPVVPVAPTPLAADAIDADKFQYSADVTAYNTAVAAHAAWAAKGASVAAGNSEAEALAASTDV